MRELSVEEIGKVSGGVAPAVLCLGGAATGAATYALGTADPTWEGAGLNAAYGCASGFLGGFGNAGVVMAFVAAGANALANQVYSSGGASFGGSGGASFGGFGGASFGGFGGGANQVPWLSPPQEIHSDYCSI